MDKDRIFIRVYISVFYSISMSVLFCTVCISTLPYSVLTILPSFHDPFRILGILASSLTLYSVRSTLQQNNTAQPNQAKPPEHDTKIDIPAAPKSKSQSMIFRSTNGSVTSYLVCVYVWYRRTPRGQKCRPAPAETRGMNHERPRGSTAKNWSPRHNYLVRGAWLGCLAGAWQV